MGLQGRLTRERLGYSMPPTSPLFPKPPVSYTGVETVAVSFETDAEAALDVLPEALELPEPAIATAGIYRIPASTLGSYHEAYLVLNALWEGKPCRYDIMFMVTNDMALSYGREILGVPKVLGHVLLEKTYEGVFAYAERPKGHRLLSLGVALEERMDVAEAASAPVPPAVGLRIIGQPEGAEEDVTAELIETGTKRVVHEQWRGTGMVAFPERSQINDWGVLPVNKIIGAFFSRMDVELPAPRLLAKL
jgi:acetoacetate decarboxylase